MKQFNKQNKSKIFKLFRINNFKKAQSLSLNTIIIAALALIVLVVLVFIFSGKIKVFGEGTENCVNLGGECSSEGYTAECIKLGSCNCPEGKIFIKSTNCEKTGSNICCKKVY